ncbi:MAG TPA: PfkB family carbohydrate kinase [Sphingomicrobium sp.]|nr:PfkB family carbohydrate kinase [Sphingomicrobium sp.]
MSGESLMDVFHEPQPPSNKIALTATAGGSPFNCAIALARLGGHTGFLCPISRDRFGEVLLGKLNADNVEVLLKERVTEPTTLAMVTLDEARKAKYVFYRHSDRAFTREGLLAALPKDIALYQIGGFIPLLQEDADIWKPVVDAAAAAGATISIDPNVRPLAIDDKDAFIERLDPFLDRANLIKISSEDLEYLYESDDYAGLARDLLHGRPNCELVVVTLAEKGSMAVTAAGEGKGGIYNLPNPEPGADTVGAGDTLMAGIITWLSNNGSLAPDRLGALDGAALDAMLRFGSIAAGINCSRVGANPPTRAEVEAVLAA